MSMQNAQSGSEAVDGIKKEDATADVKESGTKVHRCHEFAKKTGYSLTVGQNLRKYGGPPPDGSDRPKGAEIFLGRLPRDMYEDELVPVLEKFGKLWEVRVLLDEKGESGRGFAFATFYDNSVANNVVRQLTNRPIPGRPGTKWSISLSKPHALVMITNLPKHKTRADLMRDFEGLFEGVLETNIWGIDPEVRPPKLWASLEFGSERAAVGALHKIVSHEAQPYDYPLEAYYSTCEYDKNAHTCVVHARNLMESATEADLNKLFAENFPDSFERARIVNKFAFLHFRDHNTADRALQEYYGYTFMGRKLELAWARTKAFTPDPPPPMQVSEESMERLNAPPQRRDGRGGGRGGGGGGGGRGRGRASSGGRDRGERGGGGSGSKSSRPAPYPSQGGPRQGPPGPYGERPPFDDRAGGPYGDRPRGGPSPYGASQPPAYQPRGPFAPQPRISSAEQYQPRQEPYYPPQQQQPEPYQEYGAPAPRYDQPPQEAYRGASAYDGSLLPQPGYQQGYQQQQQQAPPPQQYQQRQPYGCQPEPTGYSQGPYGQAPAPPQPQYGGQYGQQDGGYGAPPVQPQYQPQAAYAPQASQPAYAPQPQPALLRPSQPQSSLLNPPYLNQGRTGGESQVQADPYGQQGQAAATAQRPMSGKSFAARFGQPAQPEHQTNRAPQQQKQQQPQQVANGAYANGWEY